MRYVCGSLHFVALAVLAASCQLKLINPATAPSSAGVAIQGLLSIRARSCASYLISINNAGGSPAAASTSTWVALSGNGSGKFYSDSACGKLISQVEIAAGSGSSTVYFMDPVAESSALVASALGYSGASLSIAIGPGNASVLSLSGPTSLSAGSCSGAYTVTSFDASGNASGPTSAKTINLVGAGAGQFYLDSSCSSATTRVTLAAGASSTVFYLKDPAVQSLTLSASASGFSSGTLPVTIVTAAPATLALSGPSNIKTSTCSGPYTATLKDANGNTVPTGTGISVALSGGGAGFFYSDAGCSAQVGGVAISSGSSSQIFYFWDASVQTLTFAAASAGLANGTEAVSVALNSPTQLSVSGPATVNTGYCSTSAYVVTLKDGGGLSFTAGAPVTVNLSGGNGALFYADSSCATAPITQITISAGSSQASAYMKDNIGESLNLTAASPGMTSGSVAVTTSAIQNRIDIFAGNLSSIGYRDGTGANARFHYPTGITTDGTNLYVLDQGNATIRKIVISTGAVTLLAGAVGQGGFVDGTGSAARFTNPQGLATDGTNLYVADNGNNAVRQVVIATGAVTTLAGSGAFGSADGTGAAATFNQPSDVVLVGGNLYVTDTGNNTIRKIVVATGAVTTFAGRAGSGGLVNATGSAARFYNPWGITSDGTNLYVADFGNSVIRKIVIATAAVSTLAGSYGSQDGVGLAAGFNGPAYLSYSGGALYITDYYNSGVRKLDLSTLMVTTLAGNSGSSGYGDGTGRGAYFNAPWGVVSDGSGNLYVADQYNSSIRKIVISSGVVTTPFGALPTWGAADGTGTAARFYNPAQIASDGVFLYAADTTNDTIRKIAIATGAVTTLAGSPLTVGSADGTGVSATFDGPTGVTYLGGNLYVADQINCTIRKIVVSTAAVSTFAGSPGICGSVDATGSAARFSRPYAITNDGTNLYVTDTSNYTIRKIVIATGAVTTLAGYPGVSGWTDGAGTAGRFADPEGIVTDGTNLFVADRGNCDIRQVVIATGVVSTIAGAAGACGVTDGTGAAASFLSLRGLSMSGSVIYATDEGMIRTLNVNTAVVTTIAGTAYLDQDDDGLLTAPAHLSVPVGVLVNSSGLFITNDSGIRWLH